MTIKVDLKSQEVKRGFTFDYGWIVWLIFVVIALIGFLWYNQDLDRQLQDRVGKLNKLQSEIDSYKPIQPAIERLRQEVSAIQGQIGQLKELRYDTLKYAVLLSNFTALLPSTVWINNLNLEPGRSSVSFSATAVAREGSPPLKSIAEMIRNMQNSPYFSSVSVSNIAEAKQGDKTTFNVNVEAGYHISIAELKGSERP